VEEEKPEPAVPAQPEDGALARRVSDAEREEVAELIRHAAGEGRLTFAELEERLEAAYASKTYGQLVELTADLPGGLQATPSSQALSRPSPTINAFLSESKRTGNWLASPHQEVNAVLADVTLDYTEAQIPYDEIHLEVKSILADVKIRVPQNAIVHIDGQPILGSVTEQGLSLVAGGSPSTDRPKVFHIRGTAVLGEIKVKRGPRLAKRLGFA